MKRPDRSAGAEEAPESDRAGDAPHPRRAEYLFGHAAAEQELLAAYRGGRFAHAWIFGGRPGIGKATLAWRLAKFLMANPDPGAASVRAARSLAIDPRSASAHQVATLAAPGLVLLRREWNTAARPPRFFTEIRVDDVRAALARFHLTAPDNGWRIAIIDAGDDLNRSAANALLKMIEEPPARSLFLIVSHQPGRLLPTIRSRCRRLVLTPLTSDELKASLSSLGHHNVPDAIIETAQGSVGEALRLLGRQGSDFARTVEGLLHQLPSVDWRGVTALAERLAPPRAEADFEAFLDIVFRFIDGEVRAKADQHAARLAPYAHVWEQFVAAARATDTLNLDRRPLVLSIFEELGAAAAAAR
jgi:DNA polymerase-3 subunit delta'